MSFLETPAGPLWVRALPGNEVATAGSAPLVALHGFSLHGGSFAALAARLGRPVLAPDLPGHGRTPIPPTIPAAVQGVAELLEATGPPLPLLGYSQGGRIALHVALERPALVSALVLVSTSPGLAEVPERAARREQDEDWADLLDTRGLEAFLHRWLTLPLFSGLRNAQLEVRRENDPHRLAGALRGMGVGVQRYLGERVGELAMPVLLVAGGRDGRYVRLAAQMAEAIPRARVQVVPGVGHAVPADAPEELGSLLEGFLG